MSSPLVSIVMPAYNAAAYLKTAVDSVLAQSHENWQLIVVNDGSSDSTEEILKTYTDPRIWWTSQNNGGVSAARNRGLKEVRGEYLCFLDSDDAWPKHSLRSRLKKFDEDSEIEFVDGRVAHMDAELQNQVGEFVPSFKGNPLRELLFLNSSCFVCPSWMIKIKEDKTYSFDTSTTHGEDMLFFMLISRSGLYDWVDEPTLLYRGGHGSAMSNLRGLERGYKNILLRISEDFKDELSASERKQIRNKAASVMAKSYLKRKKFTSAFRVWRSFRSLPV